LSWANVFRLWDEISKRDKKETNRATTKLSKGVKK
jgi:hypothetical protein